MRKSLPIFLISIFLGFLMILQIESVGSNRTNNSSVNAQNLTAKIILLNKEMNLEKDKILDLQKKHEAYQNSLNNNENSKKLIVGDLLHYQKFAGEIECGGSGIEIVIDKNLTLEEIIDFVNNLKNIGIEGLSINGNRLIISSSFGESDGDLFLDNKKISSSYKFLAIGNPDILKDGLERKGGILEQLKEQKSVKIEITKKDNISLPIY